MPAQSQLSGIRNPWLQLALSTISVTVSQLLLKRGAMETIHLSERWAWTGLNTLGSPLVWLGMFFVMLSFITWLYVLRHLPLSVAFPASQAVHVLVPLASWWFLGEDNWRRALVRNRVGARRPDDCRSTGGQTGGAVMTPLALFLILLSLVAFVAGQLWLKHAMDSASTRGFFQRTFIVSLLAGTAAMAVGFFLTLGLLQRFDLSYLYAFQGLTVIFVSLAAMVLLREKLTLQLVLGSLLITAGVVTRLDQLDGRISTA